jgi:hypothetical protein
VIFNEERIKNNLDKCAEAIESKCSVLNKCVGFKNPILPIEKTIINNIKRKEGLNE